MSIPEISVTRSWRTRGANRISDPTVILVGDAEVEEMIAPGPSLFVPVDILVEEIAGDDVDDAVTHYGWRDRGDDEDSLPCGVFPRFHPDRSGAADEIRAEMVQSVRGLGSPWVVSRAIRAMRSISTPWMVLDITFISGTLIAGQSGGPMLLPLLSDSDFAQERGVGRRVALRVSVVRTQERARA